MSAFMDSSFRLTECGVKDAALNRVAGGGTLAEIASLCQVIGITRSAAQ
jgi:hypothetical protein